MNIYDPYPDEVNVNGRVYKLDLAYDRVLRVMDVQSDPGLTDDDRLELQARLLLRDDDCPVDPGEQEAIIEAALNLLPKGEASGERYIDFHQDAAMIRSAFFRIGVDLTRERIHICQFLELLADLPEDTALMRTVDLRRRPLPKPNGHNAEQIAELQRAKARVALVVPEEEREKHFLSQLKNSTTLKG